MQASQMSVASGEYTGPERRSALRVPLNTQAFITSRHQKFICNIVDVSTGGLAVRLESLELLERQVKVEFYLPGISCWQKLDARVVRAARNGHTITWGLSFCAPDERATAHIEGFVCGQNGG